MESITDRKTHNSGNWKLDFLNGLLELLVCVIRKRREKERKRIKYDGVAPSPLHVKLHQNY